jgi:hypothetical protein
MTLKEKYPNAKYPPNPSCKFCLGTGERHKTINSMVKKTYACACLFLHPDYCEEVAIEIAKAAKKLKSDIFGDLGRD